MYLQHILLKIRKTFLIFTFIPTCISDLGLGVKVTQDIAQYPLHHVTYAPAKFKVSLSKDLGGDAFSIKYII